MTSPRQRADSLAVGFDKGEALLSAATEGDIAEVNRLLLADTDVNYANKVRTLPSFPA